MSHEGVPPVLSQNHNKPTCSLLSTYKGPSAMLEHRAAGKNRGLSNLVCEALAWWTNP